MGESCLWLLMLVLVPYLCFAEPASAKTNTTSTSHRSVSGVVSCPAPRPCECERIPGRLVINCRQQRLDRVPTFSRSDELVDELTLADNRIVVLPNSAFRGLRVHRLDLKDNQLATVFPEAFSGLEPYLEDLLIQLDRKAEFPSRALVPLTLLRVLDVIGYGGASLPSGALASLGLVRELRLTYGGLQRMTPNDVTAMRASLSVVDLSGNPLRGVPTAALANLSNLTEVLLSGCQIASLGARAFATNWTLLRRIDLSQNQLETVDEDAFRGMGGQSVHDLSIRSSHLSDEHVPALLSLTKLHTLDIALNKKITAVDGLLDALPSLETLDASFDGISSLGRVPFASRALRVLNVAYNQLVDVAADAFDGLTALEELRLDGARLSLANNSFAEQRTTLKTLSLRRCNFTRPPWPSVAGLGVLEKLYMSECSVHGIPDFTFMGVGRLQTLDLSGNWLQQLTQRSLAGLHAHLEIIKLDNNRLSTLDRCVFYRFDNIDLLKLGLANNPLQCVCDLRWLYKRLQPYNETFWFSAIQWRCTDVNKMFNKLVDEDFASCDSDSGLGNATSECEDLIPTTTPAVIYPADPRLKLEVTSRTQSSVTIEWTVSAELDVADQVVTHQWSDSIVKERLQLAATQRRYVLTGLHPNTTYKICVELTVGNGSSDVDPVVSCCPSMTSSGGPSTLSIFTQLVVGILVGGGLAAVIITSLAVYCCCAARRRRQRPVSSSAPRQSVQTKRFRKLGTVASSPTGADRTSNPYNASQADVDRAIVESVERLDPESKEVLANLLRTASAYSLDHIGGTSTYPSPPTSSGYVPAGAQGRPTSTGGDRHFYEELPDDTYDQIPTDDFV